jgi:biotin synthase-related radical SAM superfamily protein
VRKSKHIALRRKAEIIKISECLSAWLLELTAESIQITFKTGAKLLSVAGAVKTQRPKCFGLW